MCSLVAHDRLQENYQDDDISLGDKVIPKDATVKSLQSLGATFNFIDMWLLLEDMVFWARYAWSCYFCIGVHVGTYSQGP